MKPHLHFRAVFAGPHRVNALHRGLVQDVSCLNCKSNLTAVGPQIRTITERVFIVDACDHVPVAITSRLVIELEEQGG